jgi:hypothetical protein
MNMLDNELQNAYACPAVGTHYANVGVPVTVKPFAIPGPVTVECYGSPLMSQDEQCRGKIGAVCHFTISQKIKIDIPVDFGAAIKVGETYVECDHFCAEPSPTPNLPMPNPPGPNMPGPNPPSDCNTKY